MHLALACALIAACASGHHADSPSAASPGTAAAGAAAGSPGAPREAAFGAADDGPCASDGDCDFTRFAPGACCPMLCEPRAVTRKAAQAAEAQAGCAGARECPQPLCRPPRQVTYPACEQRRCVAKAREGGAQ